MPTEVQIKIDGAQVTITVKDSETDGQLDPSHGHRPHPPIEIAIGNETPPVSRGGGKNP